MVSTMSREKKYSINKKRIDELLQGKKITSLCDDASGPTKRTVSNSYKEGAATRSTIDFIAQKLNVHSGYITGDISDDDIEILASLINTIPLNDKEITVNNESVIPSHDQEEYSIKYAEISNRISDRKKETPATRAFIDWLVMIGYSEREYTSLHWIMQAAIHRGVEVAASNLMDEALAGGAIEEIQKYEYIKHTDGEMEYILKQQENELKEAERRERKEKYKTSKQWEEQNKK